MPLLNDYNREREESQQPSIDVPNVRVQNAPQETRTQPPPPTVGFDPTRLQSETIGSTPQLNMQTDYSSAVGAIESSVRRQVEWKYQNFRNAPVPSLYSSQNITPFIPIPNPEPTNTRAQDYLNNLLGNGPGDRLTPEVRANLANPNLPDPDPTAPLRGIFGTEFGQFGTAWERNNPVNDLRLAASGLNNMVYKYNPLRLIPAGLGNASDALLGPDNGLSQFFHNWATADGAESGRINGGVLTQQMLGDLTEYAQEAQQPRTTDDGKLVFNPREGYFGEYGNGTLGAVMYAMDLPGNYTRAVLHGTVRRLVDPNYRDSRVYIEQSSIPDWAMRGIGLGMAVNPLGAQVTKYLLQDQGFRDELLASVTGTTYSFMDAQERESTGLVDSSAPWYVQTSQYAAGFVLDNLTEAGTDWLIGGGINAVKRSVVDVAASGGDNVVRRIAGNVDATPNGRIAFNVSRAIDGFDPNDIARNIGELPGAVQDIYRAADVGELIDNDTLLRSSLRDAPELPGSTPARLGRGADATQEAAEGVRRAPELITPEQVGRQLDEAPRPRTVDSIADAGSQAPVIERALRADVVEIDAGYSPRLARELAEPGTPAKVVSRAASDGTVVLRPIRGVGDNTAIVLRDELVGSLEARKVDLEAQLSHMKQVDAQAHPEVSGRMWEVEQQIKEIDADLPKLQAITPDENGLTPARLDTVLPTVSLETVQDTVTPVNLYRSLRGTDGNLPRITANDLTITKRSNQVISDLAYFKGDIDSPRLLDRHEWALLQDANPGAYSTYGNPVSVEGLAAYRQSGAVRVQATKADPIQHIPETTTLVSNPRRQRTELVPIRKTRPPSAKEIADMPTHQLESLLSDTYSEKAVRSSGVADSRKAHTRRQLQTELNTRKGLPTDPVNPQQFDEYLNYLNITRPDNAEDLNRLMTEAQDYLRDMENINTERFRFKLEDSLQSRSPEGDFVTRQLAVATRRQADSADRVQFLTREIAGLEAEMGRDQARLLKLQEPDYFLNQGTHSGNRKATALAEARRTASARSLAPDKEFTSPVLSEQFYIGTKADIAEIGQLNAARASENVRPLGYGVYMTTNPTAADDSARKLIGQNTVFDYQGNNGVVHTVQVKADRLYNARIPLEEEGLRRRTLTIMRQYLDEDAYATVRNKTKGAPLLEYYSVLQSNPNIDPSLARKIEQEMSELFRADGFDGVVDVTDAGTALSLFNRADGSLPIERVRSTVVGSADPMEQAAASMNVANRNFRDYPSSYTDAEAARARIRTGEYLKEQLKRELREAHDEHLRNIDRVSEIEDKLAAIVKGERGQQAARQAAKDADTNARLTRRTDYDMPNDCI